MEIFLESNTQSVSLIIASAFPHEKRATDTLRLFELTITV
ncbi:hypothetical protein SB444474_5433, partial [Shigella boydii 4444-74]